MRLPQSSSVAPILPPRPGRILAAAAVALGIALLIAALFGAILAAVPQGSVSGDTVDLWHLIRMTALQASLSTLLSLAVGVALAWALNRLRFSGRDLVVALFAAAIVTPGLIVAFGLLTVWGRNGLLNAALGALFGPGATLSIYGLGGILLAHVVLDGAFAARVLLTRLDGLPQAQLKTGQSLGLTPWQRFTLLDWPALRPALPALGAIIFLLAFTSFPVVLLLGGGPANQTLEVAIYSAVRLDFDLAGAVRLALVQMALCAAVILASAALKPVPVPVGPTSAPLWRDRGFAALLQWLVLALGLFGFGAPLLAVLLGGISPDLVTVLGRAAFWTATATSLVVGVLSAALTLLLALVLSVGRAALAQRLGRTALGAPGYAYLAVPAVVLSLGFFLLARALGLSAEAAAPPVVIIANALLALPFALATLGPPLDAVVRGHGRLIRSLGLSGWRQFTAVELPLVRREIGLVLALSFCFSLGDLGVIALFGTQDFVTLPLLMYRSLGAYRSDDAAVIAAALLALTLLAFFGLPRLLEGRRHAGA